MTVTQQRVLLGIAAAAVGLGVIAVALTGRDDGVVAVDGTTTSTAVASSTTSSSTVTESTTTLESSPATTLSDTATTTAPADPAMPDVSSMDGDLLAEMANGTRIVRYAAETELDCAEGLVVAELDGAITEVYERAGRAGYIVAFPGPFDGLALVGTCEESIDFVAFVEDSGPVSGDAAPTMNFVALPDDVIRLSELGWLGETGYFGAIADRLDDRGIWVEAVAFSPESAVMALAADILGTRRSYPSSGFDLVVPDQWEVFEQPDDVVAQSPESDALVRVTLTEVELPAWAIVQLDDETVVEEATIVHQLYVDIDGRARRDRLVDALEVTLESPAGRRVVRQIVFDGVTYTIEYFTPAAEGLAYVHVPRLTAASVRVFSSYG